MWDWFVCLFVFSYSKNAAVLHHMSLQAAADVLITGTRHPERGRVRTDRGCVRAGTWAGFLGSSPGVSSFYFFAGCNLHTW